ncbi:hypothetical protein CAEBREN_22623 [Caenorhabditis brenneri]|uniref:Uncharacterized protein n=1 Tax=Caenorhabditis brenneri TaxID=135651 RepID=G0MDS9_CAEBE|nr:hypothetical protein CAEBREN_22623 [Caenorhabditis brenneri]
MTKPLTDLSAECAVLYLDPSLRLVMRQKCPGFDRLESKVIPMQIRHLKTSNEGITINGTTFKLGIAIIYKGAETPEYFLKKNSEGGAPWEIDSFGFKSGVPVPTPGSLSTLEETLKRLKENINFDQIRPVTDHDRASWKTHQQNMEMMERDILLLRLKGNNQEPMIERYIQLLVIDKNHQTLHVEHWEYNMTLSEARSRLIQKLFVGKKKIEIRHFEPHSAEVMELIMPAVDKPIESITLFYDRTLQEQEREWPRRRVYDNQMIENCKKLIVPWGRITVHTLCRRVHYEDWIGELLLFTDMCRADRYTTGYHFSIKIKKIKYVKKEMKRLRNSANGFETEIPETRGTKHPKCVTVVNGKKEINFYIESIPEQGTLHFHGRLCSVGYATRV